MSRTIWWKSHLNVVGFFGNNLEIGTPVTMKLDQNLERLAI